MPKTKTNKSVAKRIRVSKNGKIKRNRPGRRHLMSHKDSKHRKNLRKVMGVAKVHARAFRMALND